MQTQVDPANENESLRQREAALQRCVAMLSDALRQWTALGEASPARLGADAAAPAAPELDLPPLPEMSEALTQLHTVAALHADQVEATMRRLDTMCEESARQRKQMSTTAHQAAFGGCARRCCSPGPPAKRDRPRLLSRAARVAGTSMSTSPACSSAAWSPHECATRACLARAARLGIRGRTGVEGTGSGTRRGRARAPGVENRAEGWVVVRGATHARNAVSHVCSRSCDMYTAAVDLAFYLQ